MKDLEKSGMKGLRNIIIGRDITRSVMKAQRLAIYELLHQRANLEPAGSKDADEQACHMIAI